MIIGTTKELKNHEYRVGLTPDNVMAFTAKGHTVYVETHAGEGAGFSDEEYAAAGATVLQEASEVFAKSDMIVKVKEPEPCEYAYLKKGQILFTYLHLAPNPALADALMKAGTKAVAFETITDGQGNLPCLRPMSQIAGRLSIQEGAKYLEKERKKAEKRKKYGYEEPTAMDWSQFSDTVHNDDKDSRRPKGNNAEELPAYMKKGYAAPDAQAEAVNVQGVQENEKVPTEEERAMAAADAVIAAARGNEDIADDREDAAAYKQYRDGARNVYEQYRDEDIRAEKHAQSAPRPSVKQQMSATEPPRPVAKQPMPSAEPPRPTAGQQMPAAEPPKPAPEFTQDLDDDFEFQFLNIKHDYQ